MAKKKLTDEQKFERAMNKLRLLTEQEYNQLRNPIRVKILRRS